MNGELELIESFRDIDWMSLKTWGSAVVAALVAVLGTYAARGVEMFAARLRNSLNLTVFTDPATPFIGQDAHDQIRLLAGGPAVIGAWIAVLGLLAPDTTIAFVTRDPTVADGGVIHLAIAALFCLLVVHALGAAWRAWRHAGPVSLLVLPAHLVVMANWTIVGALAAPFILASAVYGVQLVLAPLEPVLEAMRTTTSDDPRGGGLLARWRAMMRQLD